MNKVFTKFKIMIDRKVHYRFPTNNGLQGNKKLEGVDYIKNILEEALITN
jgi:hypothetical protein